MNTFHKQSGNILIIALVLVAVLVGASMLYYRGAKMQKDALEAPLPLPEYVPEAPTGDPSVEIGSEDEMLITPGESSPPSASDGETVVEARPFKEFDVSAKNFQFSVKEIRVNKGDFVRINFKSESGFHDWTVDEFNAKTKQLNAGQGDSVDFTVDKTGTFEFYCSVGTHRQMGMVGKLIIE